MSEPAANPWYLARDGEQFGPISEPEMAKLVELGHLKPNDLLWREGFPDWRPAMVVFPPHSRPLPGGPRLTRPDAREDARHDARHDARLDAGRPRMMETPLAGPPPEGRGGYIDRDPERPGVLRRIARLLLLVAALAGAAGAAYVFRDRLAALLVSLNAPSGAMAIADRRSLELPPLAGFRAATPEGVDANLQATAVWRVLKREFPDWYKERLGEAGGLAREGKDDAVIAQLMARKLVELRRKEAASGLSATPEKLRMVATAYLDSLTRLRSYNPEACSGFIRRGEAEPLIVALLQQGTEHTAHLQAQLTAVFEAIAVGRQLPRVHPRPTREQHELLAAELAKRGWTADDFKVLTNDQALAQATPEKVCQLVSDFFIAQLTLPDQEAQMRLLVSSLRSIFVAG